MKNPQGKDKIEDVTLRNWASGLGANLRGKGNGAGRRPLLCENKCGILLKA